MTKTWLIGLVLASAWCGQAQTYVDLAPLFNADAVLEPGGRFANLGELRQAKLGVTVGNNFVISVAAAMHEPSVSTDGYTVVADSMVIFFLGAQKTKSIS